MEDKFKRQDGVEVTINNSDFLGGKDPLSFGIYTNNKNKTTCEEFIAQGEVATYKQNLLTKIPFGTMAMNDMDDILKYIEFPLQTLAKVEKKLIDDLKEEGKKTKSNYFNSIKVPNYKSISNLDDLEIEIKDYITNFNKSFSKFYFGVNSVWNPDMNYEDIKSNELKQLKKSIIDDINGKSSIVRTSEYDIFLKILYCVSKSGGFRSESGVKKIEKTNKQGIRLRAIKIFESLIEDKITYDKGTIADLQNKFDFIVNKNANKFGFNDTKLFNFSINKQIEGNQKKPRIVVKLDKGEKERIEEKFNDYLESYEPFQKYIVPIFKQEIKKQLSEIFGNDINKIEKIIKKDEHWRTYHKALVTSGYKISEATFVTQNINAESTTFFKYTFKGDFGEYLTRVTNVKKGLEVLGLGADSSNKTIMGGVKPGTDEILIINNNKYGIQDKEFSIKYHNGIDLNLYSDKNLTPKKNFSLSTAMELLPKEYIEVLASLIELYDDSTTSADKEYINRILRFADIGQLRAAMYEGMKDKAFDKLTKSDIIYNPIYKISGTFIPSSCLLAKRYCDILRKTPLNKPNSIYTYERKFYEIRSFNDDIRDTVLRKNWRNRCNNQTQQKNNIYIENLTNQSEINNILAAIKISAKG